MALQEGMAEMLCLTEWLIHRLQKLGARKLKAHIALGKRGEAEAYFYLRRLGYRIVTTNFRVPNNRGEIDLIGWDDDVLCFIEVKTRLDDSFAPPSTAVTGDKQEHIRSVAKAYLRRLPRNTRPACRFDVVSVVPSSDGPAPDITLRKGAFPWSARRKTAARDYRDYGPHRFRTDTRNLPKYR
jgi:putative endonuclease